MISKRSIGLLALATYLMISPRARAQEPDRSDDAHAIREHIDSIFNAYRDKDAATIRATHSKDWRGFLRSTTNITRGIDEYMAHANRGLQSPGGVTGYDMLEFDVAFHSDDFAVVSYIADMHVGLRDQHGTIKLRVLDVYSKRDDHWIQVASNTSTHPESAGFMRPVSPRTRQELLTVREAVWRAYFENDQAELERLVPDGTVAIHVGRGGLERTIRRPRRGPRVRREWRPTDRPRFSPHRNSAVRSEHSGGLHHLRRRAGSCRRTGIARGSRYRSLLQGGRVLAEHRMAPRLWPLVPTAALPLGDLVSHPRSRRCRSETLAREQAHHDLRSARSRRREADRRTVPRCHDLPLAPRRVPLRTSY